MSVDQYMQDFETLISEIIEMEEKLLELKALEKQLRLLEKIYDLAF